MKRTTITIAIAAGVVFTLAQTALAGVLVEFDRARSKELTYAGFQLDAQRDLQISDVGYAYRSSGNRLTLSDAWILDSKTRDVVWDLYSARDEWKSRELVKSNFTVTLPAGDYEVYYSTFMDNHRKKWYDSGDWKGFFGYGRRGPIDRLIENEDVDDVEDLYRKFSFRIEGDGRALDRAAVDDLTAQPAPGTIASLRRQGDHVYREQGFELSRPMKIRIYAVGEANDDGVYDYAWIMKADTREKVWRFTYKHSENAGGADKNRVVDSTFEAPAGRYVLAYTTDDSHSWERWNSPPPYDPSFWGVTLRADASGEAQYAKLFDYEQEAWKNTIVDLTRVGDDELVRAGFTLKVPMDLRVYAIGEGTDGEMYDYGWIVNATTRKRVWTMEYDETEHAGGAKKNRIFDGIVHLDKGNYVVYYGTDGSHSYPQWNSTAPEDRRRWGITVLGTGDFNARNVTEYNDEEKSADALVALTGIGNHEHVSREFTLKKETLVNVYALGEGVDGRMYDYGWIEEAESGRVVWEMTYRKTDHAGGASKNRMYSDTITLEPGKYRVFYESDGSHSYGHWNASPPYEPQNWGISLHAVPNS